MLTSLAARARLRGDVRVSELLAENYRRVLRSGAQDCAGSLAAAVRRGDHRVVRSELAWAVRTAPLLTVKAAARKSILALSRHAGRTRL